MAFALARRFGKVNAYLRTLTPSVQVTANYARQRKVVRTSGPSDQPTYRVGGIFEPDYLHLLQPKTEEYSILDIDIKSYEYPVLEKYHSYLVKKIGNLDLEHFDSYGHPNQVIDVDVLKPKSEIVQEVFHLRCYKRTVQIADVPVYKIGLIIDVLHATAPPGVTFTVVVHDDEREEARFVPDVYMTETKRELENLISGK